jgi:transcriptional regulator with XRE-family HTH domain
VSLTSQDWADIRNFGANVRRERVAKNFTQEKLAELTNLHSRTIQKIEAGTINLLLPTVYRLKRALKCPWARLLD